MCGFPHEVNLPLCLNHILPDHKMKLEQVVTLFVLDSRTLTRSTIGLNVAKRSFERN
jgi:hypothetical protein